MSDIYGDDLTEADLKFLERFNKLGKSDTADSEYGDNVDLDPEAEVESDIDGQYDLAPDPDAQSGDEPPEESNEVDDSKMDLSEIESEQTETRPSDKQKDHLESGEDDSENQEDDSELEYDQLGDQSDDEADDDYAPEQDDELIEDYQNDTDTQQVEEDDGEGERGNSDEARETDEPIGSGDDSEEEPDDKGEDEADETIDQETFEQAKADAKKEMQGDAQQELENHQQKQNGQPDTEGKFSDLPGAQENCSDHCEDNEGAGEHECPRCAERIMRERKLWGVVATDMNGADLLPGDKVRVEIPMSFFAANAILTVNVPNSEMDRIASKTSGEQDDSALWLSGKNISQFTGWNFNGMPVWTFTKGRVLRFAAKIGEPIREGGGQGDIEDQVEDLHHELDNLNLDDFQNQSQEDDEPEPEESESEDGDPEEDQHKYNGKLTSTQIKRFENLFERLEKKITQTFGNTAETVKRGDIVVSGDIVARPISIQSRGVEFAIVLTAKRSDV